MRAETQNAVTQAVKPGLRIAIIGARGIPAKFGGFETAASELAPRLVQLGHEVTVYCRSRYSLPSRPGVYEGVHLRYLPAIYTKSFETLSHEVLSALDAAFRPYDLVYVLGFRASFAHVVSRMSGKTVVINTDGFEWQRGKWGSAASLYLRLAEKIGARWIASNLICDSRALQPYYRRTHGRDSVFIAYGTSLYHSRRPSIVERYGLREQEYFLVVARMEPENNVDIVIREFQRVDTRMNLALVGAPAYASRYFESLKRTRDPRIRFLGAVYEPGQLEELYANAYGYIHGHEVGGTNPALVQALGGGCCVLALDVPFNAEVIGEAGMLWNKQPGNLASQINATLLHPDVANRLKDAASARAATYYSWDQIAEAYDHLFRRLVSARRIAAEATEQGANSGRLDSRGGAANGEDPATKATAPGILVRDNSRRNELTASQRQSKLAKTTDRTRRVALVHDRLEQNGGAERVLWALHSIFPEAPIYTSIWNQRAVPGFRECDVRTSWMQRLPAIEKRPRLYAALYPLAFAGLRLEDFDLIISLTSSFAQGIRTNGSSFHVCYCHSPANFIWRPEAYFLRSSTRALTTPFRSWLKVWDRWASRQPDLYVVTGRPVAERVKSFYHRSASIVPPPIEAKWFARHQSDDFYLVAARLVPHKRIELAIEACSRLGLPLVVTGTGRSSGRLRKLATRDVRFTGFVSDDELRDLYTRARAVIVPSEEEFGLVALEAQAAGTPVIAFDQGGSRETVVDGVTGIRFAPQTVEGLVAAIGRFNRCTWDRTAIQANAARFDEARFRQDLLGAIEHHVAEPATYSVQAGQV